MATTTPTARPRAAALRRPTPLRGLDLLRDPVRNRGTAFTARQREELGLVGLLPPAVLTLDQQAERAYQQYREQPDGLARNTFMEALRDRNETLYYRLLVDHLVEMLPVVYDPVIGEAVERYSHEYRRPRGVYLSVDDPGGVESAFRDLGAGADDVDLLVATDAGAILGIGDWGTNGMAIAQGKLAVYTAAAGIDPSRVVPVVLDVGTDNEALLTDPLYVGVRRARTSGAEYDALVDAYVTTAQRLFPGALLHFEDFGPGDARRILDEYSGRACVFNDDVQGTGAITLAAVLSGVRVTRTPMTDQRVVVFGAGTAGAGIADQLRDAMVRAGLDHDRATARVWLVDQQGLLLDSTPGLRDFQVPFARPAAEADCWSRDGDGRITLETVVARVHPTILVGTSKQGGAFTERVVREMSAHVDRPLVLPLSNPTEKIEARPADVIAWSDGRALVGTGTPWDPVEHGGIRHRIGQANNALLYPGLGLGTIVARAERVTPGMVLAAAEAVAAQVDPGEPGAALLPDVADLRASSATVAVAVARRAVDEGVARAGLADASGRDRTVQAVLDAMWQPVYPPVDADGGGAA